MKKSKWLALAGVTLLAGLTLAACGNSNAGGTKTYSYVYTADPDTLDYTASNRESTSVITSNLVDGLLENDQYGNFVPSIAEDWTVSADGLTYTYKIRKDAKWFTSDGEEYADVKAQDFVTGLKHAIDSKTESDYLVKDSIKGLADYIDGKDKDFSHVGIKAVDDHTLEYTLNQPESFWNSKTTSGILFPINEDFLKAQGDKFGSNDPSTLLYNGPYILKNLTAKSVIELQKNQGYWDKDNVEIEDIKLSFYDGQDVESLVRNFKEGAYSQARLFPTSSNYASVEKEYKDNITYAPQDATAYFYVFNVNRSNYSHTAKKSDAEKDATKKALLNKDFRQAINFAFNRTAYASQTNGQEGATKILRNSLVPPTFVQVGDKTFGQVADEKVVTYGDQWQGFNSEDAQDGYFNKEKAQAAFAKAKEALAAEGVTFPIHIDIPVEQTDTNSVAMSSSVKQSIEDALGKDNVVIDLNKMSQDDHDNATYFAQTADQKDYDFTVTGWGPDFQDPSTYLDILDPDKGAAMQNIGIEPGQAKDIVEKLGLNDYKALLDEANAETQDVKARYEKYAAAQAWLTDASLTIPVVSKGGSPAVSKTVPFSRANSLVGTKGDPTSYKLLKLQEQVVTSEDYEKAYKDYQKKQKESQAQAQKDLEKHVK